MGTKFRVAVILGFMVFSCMGCGRKLPPLPPGQPDPVEIVSIRYEDDTVVVRARCNEVEGKVTLLGKPKGICPSCTDDLIMKDEQFIREKSVVILKDESPGAQYMVYRIAFEKGTISWMSQAGIVGK